MHSGWFEVYGKALFGDEWRRKLASSLATVRPGERRGQPVDPRLVARWASGERPIPDWVDLAMEEMINGRIGVLTSHASRLAADRIERRGPDPKVDAMLAELRLPLKPRQEAEEQEPPTP